MSTAPLSSDRTAAVADARREHERTGRFGTIARLGVGLTLLALALFWRDPEWRDAVIGLLLAPAAITGVLVTAISNALFGRDDQVGCARFGPIDALDARRAGAAPGP